MQQENEVKSTLQELAEVRAQARTQAKQGGKEDELPEGAAPIEAKSEVEGEEVVAETEAAVQEAAAAGEPDVEEEIRIGDKVFKSQREAIRYAEQLEQEKLISEAHSMGVREALEATRASHVEQPKPEEDNFEERFYTDPKGTLTEIKQKATAEAVAQIKAEQQREALWSQFFNENPDLEGSRRICEQVLAENWETIGKMTDIPKAMKILATKTRSIFQDYIDRTKPRTELPNKGGQVVSAGGAPRGGVTPQKKEDAPLDFVSEMKRMRTRA